MNFLQTVTLIGGIGIVAGMSTDQDHILAISFILFFGSILLEAII